MNIDIQTVAQLDYILSRLSKKFPREEDNKVMTDLSFQANSETGELNVFDDDDSILATTVIPEWINYKGENFDSSVIDVLKEYFLDKKENLEDLCILHPFSLVLIDDDKETIKDFLELDDESISIDHEELMQGLSSDLDNFIENLLKD